MEKDNVLNAKQQNRIPTLNELLIQINILLIMPLPVYEQVFAAVKSKLTLFEREKISGKTQDSSSSDGFRRQMFCGC